VPAVVPEMSQALNANKGAYTEDMGTVKRNYQLSRPNLLKHLRSPWGYEDAETLPSSTSAICPTPADGVQKADIRE